MVIIFTLYRRQRTRPSSVFLPSSGDNQFSDRSHHDDCSPHARDAMRLRRRQKPRDYGFLEASEIVRKVCQVRFEFDRRTPQLQYSVLILLEMRATVQGVTLSFCGLVTHFY